MRQNFLLFATAILAAFAFSTPSFAEDWSCSARGIVSGSYSGGSSAYIHLAGYNTGNDYPATRRGNVASGVTKDGTHFTCRMTGVESAQGQNPKVRLNITCRILVDQSFKRFRIVSEQVCFDKLSSLNDSQ